MNAGYQKIIDTLRTKSVLKEAFSTAEIESFVRDSTEFQRFGAGDRIITEGEPATSLMFIISGRVRVFSHDYQLAILQEGEMFGESMFSEEGSRMANVEALTDTAVVVFSIEQYEKMVKDAPTVALRFKQLFESIYHDNKNRNDRFFYVDTTKYLALIAHNEMKGSLVNFVRQNIELLNQFPLVATGTTGQVLYREAGLVLSRKVKSGPLGGDQAIGSMISTDNIRGILFFRDPLSAHPHHADIEALGRLCDVYQIPFATNPSTAKAVLLHLTDMTVGEQHTVSPVLERYCQQQNSMVN